MNGLSIMCGSFVLVGLIATVFIMGGCGPTVMPPIAALDTPEHHVFSGMKLLERDRNLDAEREFNFAMELDPQYSPAYRGLGLVSGCKGDFRAALQHMSRAEELAEGKQEKALAYVGFMRIYTQQKAKGWLEEVEKYFEKAIETLNDLPEMPDPFYYMGMAYKEAYRFGDAAGGFKKVLEINKTLMSKADRQLKLVQKIERAMPSTLIGKDIALREKVRRIDVAALFIRELNLDRIYDKVRPTQVGEVSIPPDVKDHPLSIDVQIVIRLGIKGLDTFPNGTFAPNECIVKASYAMMIEDIIGTVTNDPSITTKYTGSASPFVDVKNDVPYFNAVMVCTTRGIIEAKGGVRQNVFGPMDPVSGAEAILAIRRLKEDLGIF
jgi:Tfp pilus assembly protein PilF